MEKEKYEKYQSNVRMVLSVDTADSGSGHDVLLYAYRNVSGNNIYYYEIRDYLMVRGLHKWFFSVVQVPFLHAITVLIDGDTRYLTLKILEVFL